MDRGKKVTLPKKKVVISTRTTTSPGAKKGAIRTDIFRKDIIQRNHGAVGHRSSHRHEICSATATRRNEKFLSDMMTELILNEEEKENMFDPMYYEDIRRKPDLWMAAFDNPIDFIEYCRKRLDNERELLEKSRRVEDEILQFVQEWTKNSEKHANILGDLYKVQDINDKLQEVIMEERTHCQHLVGLNDKLETQRQIMSRKYQASILLGKVDEKAVHHLLERNPRAVPLADKLSDLGDKIKKCDDKTRFSDVSDPLVLAERVETLEKYVDNLMKQHREETSVLKETISQGNLKCESIKAQYTDLLQRQAKSSDELKEVLSATIRENLDLQEALLKKESEFFEIHVNKMSDKIHKCSHRIPVATNDIAVKSQSEEATATVTEREYQMKLAKSEIQLAKKSNLWRDAVSKVVMLERKCARLEEENRSLKKANERTLKALNGKNNILEKRCEKTESRLKLEQDGFRHDISQCKALMKLLLRSIKSFTKEQADMKKQLVECTKTANVGVQQPETLERLISGTTQTNSELRLHAMKLWAEYIGNRVNNIEEEALISRHNLRQDKDDIGDLYVKPSIQKSKEDLRVVTKTSSRRFQEPSVDNILVEESSSQYSVPPKWIEDGRHPSKYANIIDDDEEVKISDPRLRAIS